MPPDTYPNSYSHAQVHTVPVPLTGTSRTNAELNLSVLQRHEPSIAKVLSIAPYAVIYLFSTSSQSWEKTGVEGTLFVCQLATENFALPFDYQEEERYRVMVLNRRGLNNFELELNEADDVEITDEYVILRARDYRTTHVEGENDSADVAPIYGLWIFAEPPPSSTAEIRTINAQVIQDCAIRAQMSRKSVLERNMISSQLENASVLGHPTLPQQFPSDTFAQHGQHVPHYSGSATAMSNGNFAYPASPSRNILDLLQRTHVNHHSNV